MTTNTTNIGFKLAQVQRRIIELENRDSILTRQDKRELQTLKKTELDLRQKYDIDRED